VKFTEQGRIAVAVSYHAGVLRVEVADSGVGIAADKIDDVFEKFVQGDASLTRRVGGAGLGLTIARDLTELRGGAICASSVEGRGSVFTVTAPMERLSGPQPLPDPRTETGEAAEASPTLRILAAEDNEVNRLVLSALLGGRGLAVTLVEDGAQAVEAWRRSDWDIILMDVQMPVMDGVAATRAIRAAEAATGRPRTPIVAVTANVLPDQRANYEAAGMALLVAKPIDAAALFEAIDKALGSAACASEAA
jgi:CheY-like chemotaxis protein